MSQTEDGCIASATCIQSKGGTCQMTDEERAARRERDRVRQQKFRQRQSEMDKALRREINRVRAAEKRKRRSEIDKASQREQNRIRAAERRANQSEEQKKVSSERNRTRMALRRSSETSAEACVRKERERIRAAERRARLTDEQASIQRERDRVRIAQRRAQETHLESLLRKEQDRRRMAESRARKRMQQDELGIPTMLEQFNARVPVRLFEEYDSTGEGQIKAEQCPDIINSCEYPRAIEIETSVYRDEKTIEYIKELGTLEYANGPRLSAIHPEGTYFQGYSDNDMSCSSDGCSSFSSAALFSQRLVEGESVYECEFCHELFDEETVATHRCS